MAKAKKIVPETMNIDVVDEKITAIIGMIKPKLSLGMVYSKNLLTDEEGNEFLITMSVKDVLPIDALGMIVAAIGLDMMHLDDQNIVIGPSSMEIPDMDEDECWCGDDGSDIPF